MTANASIITAERQAALRIPNAALRFRPPENAAIEGGATNAPGGKSGGANPTSKPATASGDRPSMSPGGDGAPPDRDDMRRRFANMSPEERQQMRERRARGEGPPMGFGGGRPDFGGSGAASRAAQDAPVVRTLYLLKKASDNGAKPTLKPVQVKTGISDGAYTEVLEGLKEGDLLVTGVNLPATAAASLRPGGTTPFGGPPFGGMRPPR
jgi:HlyD family secretion protein